MAAVLTELGTIAADRGDYVSAEKLLDEALDIERSVSPVPQRETAKSLVARGRVFYDKGDFVAEEICRPCNLRERGKGRPTLTPSDRRRTSQRRSWRAATTARQRPPTGTASKRWRGRSARNTQNSVRCGSISVPFSTTRKRTSDAEASYRRALAISRAAFTPEHEFVEGPHQSWPKSVRANSLQGVERNAPRGNWNCPANARIGFSDRRAGPDISGVTMLAMGQQDEAERVARESLAIALKALGSIHPWTKEAEGALGTVLVARRRWPDAEPLLLSYYAAIESNSALMEATRGRAIDCGDVRRLGQTPRSGCWNAKATPRRRNRRRLARNRVNSLDEGGGPMRCLTVGLVVLSLAGAAGAQAPDAQMIAPIQKFIDSFNKGDMPGAAATHAATADLSITDEVSPYLWRGPQALTTWAADLESDAKKRGIHRSDGHAQRTHEERNERRSGLCGCTRPSTRSRNAASQCARLAPDDVRAEKDRRILVRIDAWTWTGPKPQKVAGTAK